MEQHEPDVQPSGGPDPRRCAECNRVLVGRRADATWCSARCRMRWKRKQRNLQAARDSYSAVHPDVSLAELHDKAGPPDWRDDPRNYSDYGDLPDDFDLAAEIDYDDEHQGDEQAARFNAMLQADAGQRTPRETWRRWRAHGRRHGTEHPEQTADRIGRHQARETARMARIDRSTGGRIQDRFDTRTTANVARNANASRALNASHVEQPPVPGPGFDFQGESFNGGPYRSGRPAGQRSSHADYSWRMEDGFRF